MKYSERWWEEQKRALAQGREIDPPWVVEEDSDPYSSEWRQGISQAWMLEVWVPYWTSLTSQQRVEYLDSRDADSLWRLYLLDPERYFRGEWWDRT